jgi:predicted HTH domain antitoxin
MCETGEGVVGFGGGNVTRMKTITKSVRLTKEQAVAAYSDELVDIRSGAEMAGISYREFIKELEKRHIPLLTDVTHFHEELVELAKMFGDKELEKVVNLAIAEKTETLMLK